MHILLYPLKIMLISIDFLIMVVTFGWVKVLTKFLKKEKFRSVQVADDPSHRVHAEYKGNMLRYPRNRQKTLFELQKVSFEKYADRKCMGTREYLGMHSETPPKKKFGNVNWKTYKQVGKEAYKFGSALRSAGLVAAPEKATLDPLTTSCSLAIFENTCAEWMIAALGAFSQSIIVTTIYTTLGIDAVVDAIQDCKISAIVCNKTNVHTLVSHINDIPTIKTIIYTSDLVGPKDQIDLSFSLSGVNIISFEDFVESGSNHAYPPIPPKPETCSVIMYTSGSTGKPKGVVITHAHITAVIASAEIMFKIRDGKDNYMAYLPLAHILELTAELAIISMGCSISYADPKTLTDQGAYPKGAMEQFSPTLMAGVPKIWDVFKKKVQAKISTYSPISQFFVNTAFDARAFAINHGYDTPLFKFLVFRTFSKIVGGKLRLAMSGGGPLNSDVQIFIRTCFGCPCFQGYGLTETCAGLSIQDSEDLRSGIAGVPIPSAEVKLLSTHEIADKAGVKYLSSDIRDVDGNLIHGRGEILVRGNNLSLGYYNMKDETDEVYRKDGFFHTGDIGQFMWDGSLRVVDRVKNLVKLKGGEYIALENMEVTYGNSDFVDATNGGICCYGDGDMDRAIALMQLNKGRTMKWAEDNGVSGDFDSVKKSKELHDAVTEDLQREWKNAKLSHLEKLVAVEFLTEPWTPENGCLTAANKLQRRAVVEKFSKEFEAAKAKAIF